MQDRLYKLEKSEPTKALNLGFNFGWVPVAVETSPIWLKYFIFLQTTKYVIKSNAASTILNEIQ